MKTKFSKTDLGCVIGDDWDIFGNRVQVFDDSLRPTDTENPVLPFPFTLEQFRAFCDWHPTFQWEAIESVFTNDDGSLDDAAIGSLNPASGAADLVRAVLATHDAEFQLAWRIHEQLDQCRAQIERWERLEQNAPTPSEAIAAEGKLAGLRAELAGLLRQLSGTAQEHPQATVSQPQAATIPASASAEQFEPVSRSAAQDAVILETIRRVGHEPLSLPKNDAGKPGIKAAVRGELVAKHKLFPQGGRQFDKAWDRLSAFKEIAYRD